MDKCRSKLLSTIASEQKKHGTGKAGYYHGVWCDSSYELIFIYTHPDAVRCNLRIPYTKANGVSSTYTPDFMLDGRIYEIKGYLTENDHLKQSAARKLGIDITLLHDIEWFTTTKKEIEKTHNITNIWELYDDYKPKFTYTCSNCTKQYVTDAEKQTTKTYCSRRCAGQYMRQQNNTKNN